MRVGRRTIFLLATTALAVLLSSGVALAINTINCKTNQVCTGTERPDLMKGTDGFNEMRGRDGDDVLKGFGRFDALLGQNGDDKLLGGRGGDYVVGGKDDDKLRGEGGIDGYSFEQSDWGQDTIIEDSPSRNAVLLPFEETFTGPVATNLTPSSAPEVENPASASTVDWEGNVITFVYGSSGNDTVLGNDAANEIYDEAGPLFYGTAPDTDTITAGGGNDFIVVQDGDSDDTVDCGPGTDTVIFDEGATPAESDTLVVPTECEEQNPGEGPIFSEGRAAGESAPGGDLSEFRSFQAPPARTD